MNQLRLLDTNIFSHILREPLGAAAQRLRRVGEARVCTSIIVAAEIRFGLAKRGSLKLQGPVEEALRRIPLLPFDRPADLAYARLRVVLEAAGQPIGGNDMLIAAHALALDAVLVTANERAFRRVPGLLVENWLAP